MKIGFDAKRAFHNFSGLGNYSRDLIKHLSNFYPNINFLAFTPSEVKKERTQFLFERNNIEIITPTSPWNKALPSLWRSVNMENALVKNEIALYHGLSNEIPKRSKSSIPYVVTIHDVIFKRYPEYYPAADRKIYDQKWKYACEKSDLIIAISQQTKRDIISFYNVNPDKIKVIYQSCHEEFRKPSSSVFLDSTRLKFQLPHEFALSVGTIEARKNLKNTVLGLAQAKQKIPLVVVGKKTDYFQEVQNTIQKHKNDLAPVSFIENINIQELSALYELASVFLYPSHFEGFGIPIIEALYSNTPVISSLGGCFSEAGGPHSLYINSHKPEELAHAVDRVLEDAELALQMKEKGSNFVQKFNPKLLSQQLMSTYELLLK